MGDDYGFTARELVAFTVVRVGLELIHAEVSFRQPGPVKLGCDTSGVLWFDVLKYEGLGRPYIQVPMLQDYKPIGSNRPILAPLTL